MKYISAMRAPIRPCAGWLALAFATQLCFSHEAADDHVFADGFEDLVFADGFEPVGPTFGDVQAFTLALPPASSTLATLVNQCGTGWQLDSASPNYDCSATGWAGPSGTWHTSGEYNLVKLLT